MKQYLLIALCAISLLGCAKKKDDPSRRELLAKSWKLSAFTIDPGININGITVTDLFSQLNTCDADNLFILNASGTYQEEEGASKCNTTDNQVAETGNWTLSSDNNTLVTTPNGGGSRPTNYTIVEVNSSRFIVKSTEDFPDNIRRTSTQTFNRQ